MVELFRYSKTFEPIFLEGMTVNLFGTGLPADGLPVRCVVVGAMPEYVKDFGSLTASTWDSDQEDTNLEMNLMELGQFRMRVLDDFKLKIKNPSSVQQWRTKSTTFTLPQFPQSEGEDFLKEYMFMASEFFVWENNTPRFDAYSTLALSFARVMFSGWRFKMEKLKAAEGINGRGKYDLWVSDWPSVSPRVTANGSPVR